MTVCNLASCRDVQFLNLIITNCFFVVSFTNNYCFKILHCTTIFLCLVLYFSQSTSKVAIKQSADGSSMTSLRGSTFFSLYMMLNSKFLVYFLWTLCLTKRTANTGT